MYAYIATNMKKALDTSEEKPRDVSEETLVFQETERWWPKLRTSVLAPGLGFQSFLIGSIPFIINFSVELPEQPKNILNSSSQILFHLHLVCGIFEEEGLIFLL